jgi:hypothetical protein
MSLRSARGDTEVSKEYQRSLFNTEVIGRDVDERIDNIKYIKN